ncbi:bestrophin family protein [Sphingobacterium paludis]|uniref:Putative membrane protein n=1 Tax=Sphingobacterium paludis TaxID=1476465 RepID=A0A4R7CWC6_9SPHI|nr:bestrophin family ion channel [Sphingobacterium paludis]TDS10982.1 putative membrane protein [Sphingobacterium paludis]
MHFSIRAHLIQTKYNVMLLKGKISIFDFVKTIRNDLFAITAFSIAVGLIATQRYFASLVIPLALVAIVGTAISLLLAFRTGQAYDRWWEARIVWGAIVNDSRTLIRQLHEFLPDGEEEEIRMFMERQVIWNYALSESLRGVPFSATVRKYIDAQGIKDFNVPNAVLLKHGLQLKRLSQEGKLTEFRQVQLDTTLTKLCDSMGRCERIKNTVFPASYSALLHFLIYLFTLLLPFSLDDNYAFIKAVLTAGIPTIFIIIERTAILMQDPFENGPMDTPMTNISQNIEFVLRQQMGENVEKPAGPDPEFYYVL